MSLLSPLIVQEAHLSHQKTARIAASAHADEIEHRNAQASELSEQLQRLHATCAGLEAHVASLQSKLETAVQRQNFLQHELDATHASSNASSAQLAEQITLWRTRYDESEVRAGIYLLTYSFSNLLLFSSAIV
jgi:hypothetical protein